MTFDFTRRRFLATGAAAASLPLLGEQASAQAAWPNKPIKIIAGYPAGGQTDLFARTYGDVISRKIGQPIVVENKAGAGGTVAALEVKRAAPDGYTWQFTISTTLIMNRALMKEVPYDADKDFILISIMPAGSLPLVASTKSGAKNIKEFVDYCKKTEKVSVGTYAAGSYAHMAVAELNKQYGLKIEPVHYRGEAPMWADSRRPNARRRDRQLRRRGGGVAGQPWPGDCRVPQAAPAAAQRRDFPGAGSDLEMLPAHRLPVLLRSGRHAGGDRQENLRSAG